VSYKAPFWWYNDRGPIPALLSPFGFLYDLANRVRWSVTNPYRSRLPVICIGNFTAGGGGKTPTAIAITKLLIDMGEKPAFLTRGYGGRIIGPHIVEPGKDLAEQVGDEPLLLARYALTIVSRNRPAGVEFIETTDSTVVVMDDGFQNPTLKKNLSIITIDSRGLIGNGRVIPAGPLRASLSFQLRKTNLIVAIGDNQSSGSLLANMKSDYGLEVAYATYQPGGDVDWITSQPLIAFCGIARPEKFFDTLEQLGGKISHKIGFPDHHKYSPAEAEQLLDLSRNTGHQLVTTEKDLVRLIHHSNRLGALRSKTRALAIEIAFDQRSEDVMITFLKNAIT